MVSAEWVEVRTQILVAWTPTRSPPGGGKCPSTSDDIAYSSTPFLWAEENPGYHPDPWQAELLKSKITERSS